MARVVFVLALILSLLLPAYGQGGGPLPAEPCPMQAVQKRAQTPCADMEKKVKDSQTAPCKWGQDCKTSSLISLFILQIPKPGPLPVLACVARPAPQEAFATPWRPPRFV